MGTHPIFESDFDCLTEMYRFMILFSRQGKVRLHKWFSAIADKDRKKISKDIVNIVLQRRPKMCNFIDFMGHKMVYKRYSSLRRHTLSWMNISLQETCKRLRKKRFYMP